MNAAKRNVKHCKDESTKNINYNLETRLSYQARIALTLFVSVVLRIYALGSSERCAVCSADGGPDQLCCLYVHVLRSEGESP